MTTLTSRSREEGFALVLVLLALLVLAGIATAAAVAAVGQLRAAAMAGRVAYGRAAALGGVERVLAETRGLPQSVAGGAGVEMAVDSIGGHGLRRVHDIRIEREFHLLVGEAELDGGVSIRVARVAWWMEPESRVAAHRAVVESASVVAAASAQVLNDSLLTGRRAVAPCDQVLADTTDGGPVLATAGLPEPPEWGAGDDGPSFEAMRLGWFDRPTLAALADLDLSGGGTHTPDCPACWSGLVFGSERVRIAGPGAGVLAVDGDLVLASGVAWTGLVLASGDVTIETDGRLSGMLRAGGTVTLAENATVDGSACAALAALESADSLLRPIPLPGRSWIGPIPPGTE